MVCDLDGFPFFNIIIVNMFLGIMIEKNPSTIETVLEQKGEYFFEIRDIIISDCRQSTSFWRRLSIFSFTCAFQMV